MPSLVETRWPKRILFLPLILLAGLFSAVLFSGFSEQLAFIVLLSSLLFGLALAAWPPLPQKVLDGEF